MPLCPSSNSILIQSAGPPSLRLGRFALLRLELLIRLYIEHRHMAVVWAFVYFLLDFWSSCFKRCLRAANIFVYVS